MRTINPGDFDDHRVNALLTRHLEGMHANSPPGQVFALDWSGLQKPEISVYALWEGEDLLGVGALKELEPRAGEIKSMRTADAHLRKGVAAAILDHIIAEARRRGYARLSLETGSGPVFEPALTLYHKYGFIDGPPFGSYARSPFNQFLHLDLEAPTDRRRPLTEEEIRAAHVGEVKPLGGRVLIVDYHPQWAELFEREAARIRGALAERALRIEHVGSTSVPGLPAKPIIDIVLVVNPILGFAQLNLTGWTILVLPLYAALAAALVAAVDHQGDNWKHLLALPVPRWSLFAAKWVVAGGLLLGSSLVLTVAIVGTSELLTLMNPTLRATSIPAVLVMTRALQTCCAAGLIVSLQLWVSLRWRSFIPGLAVGVLGVMILLGGVARAGVGTIAIYLYPWALPPMAMARMAEVHHDRVLVSAGGLLAGIMVGIFGCWQLGNVPFDVEIRRRLR